MVYCGFIVEDGGDGVEFVCEGRVDEVDEAVGATGEEERTLRIGAEVELGDCVHVAFGVSTLWQGR